MKTFYLIIRNNSVSGIAEFDTPQYFARDNSMEDKYRAKGNRKNYSFSKERIA